MFFRHSKEKICCLTAICILLFGMCSLSIGGHSVFALKNNTVAGTATVYAATEYSGAAVRAQGNGVASKQAYTRESLVQHETLITAQQSLRRVNTRMGHRTILTSFLALICLIFAPILSTAVMRHFYDEITIGQVIISYIHRQDGEKNSHLLFSLSI